MFRNRGCSIALKKYAGETSCTSFDRGLRDAAHPGGATRQQSFSAIAPGSAPVFIAPRFLWRPHNLFGIPVPLLKNRQIKV